MNDHSPQTRNPLGALPASAAPRMPWVDTAKGLSIILVVMMYAAYNTGEYTGQVGFLHYVIGFATPFRMPEFFLISGLFLSQVIDRPWRRYADRRILHYAYFYAVWAIIMIGLKIGIYGRDPSSMLRDIAMSVVEPYGVLWFIYMLAVFGLVARLLWQLKIPDPIVIALAALLRMSGIEATSYILTQFVAYFVFFYIGYAAAPFVFRLVGWTQRHTVLSVAGLLVWALANGLLVFSPGFSVQPTVTHMGLATFPPLHLGLAVLGALALCVLGALLVRLSFMDWLRWLGEHSLVIYVAFTLPMSVFRAAALRTGLITETGALSLAVLIVSLASPVLLYMLLKRAGIGAFLFERPNWARLAGSDALPAPKGQVPSRARLKTVE
ncbi:acyltransferase [Mesorhizobium sp. M7A.F.Ca.US.001.04.1.1]|uniref:acyltransferase family protein n=1 Tax=unclassified Mesorhizobium TaxID=325217 RepID=UPI000FCC60B1|nr:MULTISPECIES: acyltransferase family protein [unclassified Mesorhizobium]RUY22696.1 acyltransferase [Mesorhizobium sp. M7A.F.Ca.US.001.04.2.1]RUY35587.1 acyltransferase [Mesorhizobium sp. M7A.F.Ca.US.001.04.1.1]